jgi:iron complex outermembrane recepter protein
MEPAERCLAPDLLGTSRPTKTKKGRATVLNYRQSMTRSALRAGVATLALAATPLYAQEQGADMQSAEAPAGDEATIVVTGSLITNPNLERSTPVNVTTSEEVELRQTNVAEQLLREIPGVVPSVGSAVNNGNGGASFVNLRGLGVERNLVLLDGARIAPANLQGFFDLNNIPLALIERTEVLTGGASTTYGADAVSGVVNFITKSNFSGLEIQASEQITQRGDGNVFRIDATIGANFDDGRGNAVFSIGYQEADPVYQGARDFSRYNISAFGGGVSGSGTAVPSRFSGVNTTGGDAITIGCNSPGQPVTVPGGPTCVTTVQGLRQVTNDGRAFRGTAAFEPFNFNPFNLFQTPFERFNMFGQANYEVSDGLEVYTRGLFSKNTVQTIIAPSGAFGISVTVPLNNPFLTPELRRGFCAFDTNPGVGYTPRFSQAECDAAANPALKPGDAAYREVTTQLSRRATEVGPRVSTFTTQIFDYRLGVRGSITDSINFDVSGAYGESSLIQTIQGFTLNSRVRQGLLTTRDTNGNFICRDTSNGCVPVNLFGPDGSITPAQVEFLQEDSSVQTRTSLAQARATISGDFGAALPWSEDAISFALGGEYRQQKASIASDTLGQSGDLGGGGGATINTTGGFDVYEAFGELIAPIVQDRPFFHSLTVEAGIRYSKYTVDAPGTPKFNTTTWKAGGSWEPVRDVKVRGNYSRAVRAPNINELFAPLNSILTALTDEPCASIDDTGKAIRGVPSGNLAAICLAQGATPGQLGTIPIPTAGQANVTTGGNPLLKPEKADSWTIGVVVQPEFLPGFSMSVDYYNIKVNQAITTPTVDDLLTACFGTDPQNPPAGAATSPACTVIRRNPLTGSLAGDPTTTPGLFQPTSNLGRLTTDGVDVTMNYNTDLGFAKLALSFAGNWTRSNKFQATAYANPQNLPLSVNRECVGYISSNCGSLQPEFSWTQRTTLSFDNVDLSLLWRHISAFQQEPLDRQNNFVGYRGPFPSNNSPLPGAPQRGDLGDVNTGFIEAYDYFDLSTRIGVGDNLTVTLTVANLFDKKPPLTGQDIGLTAFNSGNTFPSTYDALGRSFRVGARLRF